MTSAYALHSLTYNIANYVGSSCYEPVDGGLTRFGSNVIREMNRVGMIVDLRRPGRRPAFRRSRHPPAPVPSASHANPSAVWPHPPNLSDDLLAGCSPSMAGLLGCAPCPHLHRSG
jgi:membrane dipeptidase